LVKCKIYIQVFGDRLVQFVGLASISTPWNLRK